MNTPARSRLRLVERSGFASQPDGVADESAALPTAAVEPNWANGETAGAPATRPARAGVAALVEMPDRNLVALALAGDALAREALYRKHVSFALRLATRIEGSNRDVEDIVHDAFIKVLTRLSDLSDPAAFRSWLGSIVVFAVRSRMRRARLMNVLGLGRTSEPVDLDQLTSPDASPHVRAQLAQIYALLGTLPTDDRIAWTLRCVDGNELEVVAKLTTCSLATVKRRVSRVQKFLEQHFVDAHSRQALDEMSVGTADGSVEIEGADALPERTSPPRGKAGVRLK